MVTWIAALCILKRTEQTFHVSYTSKTSTMFLLQHFHSLLSSFFHDENDASVRYAAFHFACGDRPRHLPSEQKLQHTRALLQTPGQYTFTGKNFPWQSCKLATALVLSLCTGATDGARLYDAAMFLSQSAGNLPTMAKIRAKKTPDVRELYASAAKKATAKGEVTALGLSFVDVGMVAAGERGHPDAVFRSTFAHSLVLIVAPEGAMALQAFGPPDIGYSLKECVQRTPTPLTHEHAGDFVEKMHVFATASAWTQEVNTAYKECFGVDWLMLVARKKVSQLCPTIRVHVSVHVVEGVTIEKFNHAARYLFDVQASTVTELTSGISHLSFTTPKSSCVASHAGDINAHGNSLEKESPATTEETDVTPARPEEQSGVAVGLKKKKTAQKKKQFRF